MGFFDLNIPYPEPSAAAGKATLKILRTKLVVKAMELGYTGIAYNRIIKGVMSENDRCSIPLLTLSALLKLAPSLSMSAKLHRDLLGIPLTTPFRQYTRLTVCVDSSSQAQALNSGNPILKTYDLVAVRPLNQNAFDQACQRLEVDIILIDSSEKLPFRLKQPMVNAAAKRGVYFEVTYSGLITDIQTRRQLISGAKLLVDWTRGRNIIVSSAAPSVNELRGPCDVANLLSLLGLSKERAKAAISKNCRTIVTNALRKKRFYKEAIRVEVLSTDPASCSKDTFYQELQRWDPISSGEGDLQLDDLAKSFSASCKASKTAKAIDFTSVVDSIPSHGLQVKDILPANKAVPLFQDSNVKFFPAAESINQSTAAILDNSAEQPTTLDTCPRQDESLLPNSPSTRQAVSCDNFIENNTQSGTSGAVDSHWIKTPSTSVMLELKNFCDSVLNCSPVEAKSYEPQSGLCISSNVSDAIIPDENEKLCRSSADAKLDGSNNFNGKVEILTPCEDIIFPTRTYDMHKNEKSSEANFNAPSVTMHEDLPKWDVKITEHTSLETKTFISEDLIEDEQFEKHENDTVALDEVPQQTLLNEMKMEDDSAVATPLLQDVAVEDERFVELSTTSDQLASVQSVSGRLKVKRRTPRGPLFPFKLFKPIAFKKKAKKKKGQN